MANEIQKVKLIGINKEGIKEDLNYPDHVFLPLKLSANRVFYDIVKEVIENTNKAVDRENVRIAAEEKSEKRKIERYGKKSIG